MFVAALTDAFPDLIPGLLAEIRRLALPAGTEVNIVEHRDAAFSGRRLHVTLPADHGCGDQDQPGTRRHAPVPGDHRHSHADYRDIVSLLSKMSVGASVREHALAMFSILADAEAAVHGVRKENVAFHEVGAWDSIVDFVSAAYLIDAVGAVQWSFAPLPLGGGRISSAHGVLPVPAPATMRLLKGMELIDDGISGERVTPTGATIVRYLSNLPSTPAIQSRLLVAETGNGFGSRVLPGISNLLRCVVFSKVEKRDAEEEIFVICFEIDDQTAEDLALALDRVRQAEGVLEIYQAPVFGKKGRMAIQVQVLVQPEYVEAITELCLYETTTLGLRLTRVTRRVVSRTIVEIDEPKVRVKLAHRPGGQLTAKTEITDLVGLPGGKAARDEVRRIAECKARGEHQRGRK